LQSSENEDVSIFIQPHFSLFNQRLLTDKFATKQSEMEEAADEVYIHK
jgi:hypothetical protein